jgi:hypothetical protein
MKPDFLGIREMIRKNIQTRFPNPAPNPALSPKGLAPALNPRLKKCKSSKKLLNCFFSLEIDVILKAPSI